MQNGTGGWVLSGCAGVGVDVVAAPTRLFLPLPAHSRSSPRNTRQTHERSRVGAAAGRQQPQARASESKGVAWRAASQR